MFNKGKELVNSVIAEGVVLKGEVKSLGSIFVSGEVEGALASDGDIIISEKGKIVGNLKGQRVIVSGNVEGNIVCKNGLEIKKTGKVRGEIVCDKLFVEEGATYVGKVKVVNKREEISEGTASESGQEVIVEVDKS